MRRIARPPIPTPGWPRRARGKEAKLSYQASVLLDNRYGLVVATTVSAPSGTAEVDQAIELCATQPPRAGRRTLGADLGYDQRSLITGLRELGWTPHIAQGATSVLDGRTTRHAGYATSQHRRKRVEESFGWGKTVGLLRKLRHRGRELVDWIFTFTMAAYNLVRLRTLIDVGVGAVRAPGSAEQDPAGAGASTRWLLARQLGSHHEKKKSQIHAISAAC